MEHLSKKISNIVLPEPAGNTTDVYGVSDQGLQFLKPGRRVVVLGDSGGRTYALAKQGHYPIFIDWDPDALRMYRTIFYRINQTELNKKMVHREVLAQWVEGNWYETRTDAHAVEVFYPFSMAEFIGLSEKVADSYVHSFMEEALHSKLRPEGGTVYLLTEKWNLVKSMQNFVEKDPSLELLDVELNETKSPPIRGGHSAFPGWEGEHTSWILYKKNPR
jgi:hypothetical protein